MKLGDGTDGSAPPAGLDFVLGIDFGGTKVALATADLGARMLEQTRIHTRAEEGVAQAVGRTLAEARLLVERTTARHGGRLLSAGAVSPGIVREEGVELSPNLPGSEKLPLKRLLQEGLELDQVSVGNDAKAAGEAESRWGSLVGADPALFLSLGTGIAAAVIAGGRVVVGAHGAAGEVGYSVRGVFDEVGGSGPRAPLEEVVGGRALGERGSRLLGAPVSAADVFSRAGADLRTRFLIDETLAELAVHVANWAILLDPARIAVGGGLMRSGSLILAALRFRVTNQVPCPPEIVPAHFLDDGALRGAIALALEPAQSGDGRLVPA